jgi:cell division control protein 7
MAEVGYRTQNGHQHDYATKDQGYGFYEDDYESVDELDESQDPLEESGCTRSVFSDDEERVEEEIDELVLEDMQKFEESFRGITKRYRLLNRIGEGIHSCEF